MLRRNNGCNKNVALQYLALTSVQNILLQGLWVTAFFEPVMRNLRKKDFSWPVFFFRNICVNKKSLTSVERFNIFKAL